MKNENCQSIDTPFMIEAKWGIGMKVVRFRLAEYLRTRGITRYELSKKTGIGYPVIDGYYKNKVTRLDAYNLGRVIEALDCRLEDILTVEEQENEKP